MSLQRVLLAILLHCALCLCALPSCDVWPASYAPSCLDDEYLQLPRPMEGLPTMFCKLRLSGSSTSCKSVLTSTNVTHHVAFEPNCACANGNPALLVGSCVDISGEWDMMYYGCDGSQSALDFLTDAASADSYLLSADLQAGLTAQTADTAAVDEHSRAYRLPVDAADALLMQRWEQEHLELQDSNAPQWEGPEAPGTPQDPDWNPLNVLKDKIMQVLDLVGSGGSRASPLDSLENAVRPPSDAPQYEERSGSMQDGNQQDSRQGSAAGNPLDRIAEAVDMMGPVTSEQSGPLDKLQPHVDFAQEDHDQVLPLTSSSGQTIGLLIRLAPAPVMAVRLLGCEDGVNHGQAPGIMQLYLDGQAVLGSKRLAPATVSVNFGSGKITYSNKDGRTESLSIEVNGTILQMLNSMNCSLDYSMTMRTGGQQEAAAAAASTVEQLELGHVAAGFEAREKSTNVQQPSLSSTAAAGALETASDELLQQR